MDYPFHAFIKHLAAWGQIRSLQSVLLAPGGAVVPVPADKPDVAEALRVMHMFAVDGCSQDEYGYRGKRFLVMQKFLSRHAEDFSDSGLLPLEEGSKQTIPARLVRAVHETFRVDPMPDPDQISVGSIIALAQSYPEGGPEWMAGLQ